MTKKILLIEDELTLQKTLSEMLRLKNFEIINASEGEAGLNLAISEKPDLILLDLILPKMAGLDVLRELKRENETKNTPVIILSNLEGTKEVGEALALGAVAYLVKANYSLEEIVDKIKKILGE